MKKSEKHLSRMIIAFQIAVLVSEIKESLRDRGGVTINGRPVTY